MTEIKTAGNCPYLIVCHVVTHARNSIYWRYAETLEFDNKNRSQEWLDNVYKSTMKALYDEGVQCTCAEEQGVTLVWVVAQIDSPPCAVFSNWRDAFKYCEFDNSDIFALPLNETDHRNISRIQQH